MNRQFYNKRQTLTVINEQAGLGKLFDWSKKKFTGHMFNIKLKEKSYKIRFKALLVKIQRSKTYRVGVGVGGVGTMLKESLNYNRIALQINV